jgi:ABC-type transporter Mla subunit MlaD
MQSETALVLLSIAVAVSSLSLLVQAIASWRLYQSVRRLQEEVSPLIPQAKAALEQAQTTFRQAAAELHEAAEMARNIMESVQEQVDGIDRARQEIAAQWRVQSERIDLVLEDILGRVQDVVSVVHGTVMRPVREVSGMVAGVKAALQTLLLARRPTVDRATHDDEMFI